MGQDPRVSVYTDPVCTVPIIVTLHTDNCPSTEDGPTVTQLNPKLLKHTPQLGALLVELLVVLPREPSSQQARSFLS